MKTKVFFLILIFICTIAVGVCAYAGGVEYIGIESSELDGGNFVMVEVDGRLIVTSSKHGNIPDVLDALNIELALYDYTVPSLNSDLHNGDYISVKRVTKTFKNEEVNISYGKQFVENPTLAHGETRVIRPGINGRADAEIETVYINGVLMKKNLKSQRIVVSPADEIVEVGTKVNYVNTPRGPLRYKKVIIMEATAYDLSFNSCGKWPDDPWYGITASGTRAKPGTIAVDTNVIPFGTKLYIESMDEYPSYGFGVAEDRGGAIKGNRVDLFFENSDDVWDFGRRNVRVYILE